MGRCLARFSITLRHLTDILLQLYGAGGAAAGLAGGALLMNALGMCRLEAIANDDILLTYGCR